MDVVRILNENDYNVQIQLTLKHNHATEIVQNAEDVDLIVCSGGDGTLNQVMSGLIKSGKNIPIGYIPSGSTNDYANTLKLSFDIKEATKNIVNGSPFQVDVGQFNDNSYFAYIASFGLFSSVSYNTPQTAKNNFGHMAYVFNGFTDLIESKPYHVKLRTDGIEMEGDYILGLVSNTISIAGVMKLNPNEVDLSDGLFEVLLIKQPKDFADCNSLLNGLVNRSFSSNLFTYVKSGNIELEFDIPMKWSLDGEEASSDKIVKIKNLQNRISIVK